MPYLLIESMLDEIEAAHCTCGVCDADGKYTKEQKLAMDSWAKCGIHRRLQMLRERIDGYFPPAADLNCNNSRMNWKLLMHTLELLEKHGQLTVRKVSGCARIDLIEDFVNSAPTTA